MTKENKDIAKLLERFIGLLQNHLKKAKGDDNCRNCLSEARSLKRNNEAGLLSLPLTVVDEEQNFICAAVRENSLPDTPPLRAVARGLVEALCKPQDSSSPVAGGSSDVSENPRVKDAPPPLALAEALWHLNSCPISDLPGIARRALQEGFDCPSLQSLAGLMPSNKPAPSFYRITEELGRPPLTTHEAVKRVAEALVQRVLDPERGASAIAMRGEAVEGCDVFNELAEKFNPEHNRQIGNPEYIRAWSVRIVQAAQKWLKKYA
jgi:hypothetical protein